MSGQQWQQLDPKAREIWDQLSDEAKAVVLGYNRPNRPNTQGTSRFSGSRPGSKPPFKPGLKSPPEEAQPY